MLAVVLLSVVLPRAIGELFVNGALLQYNLALMESRSSLQPGSYIHHQTLNPLDSMVRAAQVWGERALSLSDSAHHARITLARIALDSGQDQAALEWLTPLLTDALDRPQDYSLVMDTLSRSGSPQVAIDYFQRIPEAYRLADQNLSAALAYLRLAQAHAALAAWQDREAALLEVLRYHASDLYANNQMRRLVSVRQGDVQAYTERLIFFSMEAVLPDNPGFVPYIVETIPDLLGDGVWDQSTARRVISALVWRYPQSEEIEQLLYELKDQYPDSTVLTVDYYLGELYSRRGEWREALIAYTRQSKHGHFDSLRRSSEICQSQPEACDLPRASLTAQMADLISARWADVSKACLSENGPGLRCALLDSKYDEQADLRLVSEALGKPLEEIRLGPNLLPNPTFRDWDNLQKPDGWRLMNMHYGPGRGAFAWGRDLIGGPQDGEAVRLAGFWGVRAYSSVGLRPWRGSYISEVPLRSHSQYVLTLDYMTEDGEDMTLTLWNPLSLPLCNLPPGQPDSPEISLPDTRGLWIRAYLLLCTPSGPQNPFSPAVRLWSPGNMWVHSVSLREVESLEG